MHTQDEGGGGQGWVHCGSCFLNLCNTVSARLPSASPHYPLPVCCTMSAKIPTIAGAKAAFTKNKRYREEIIVFYTYKKSLVVCEKK